MGGGRRQVGGGQEVHWPSWDRQGASSCIFSPTRKRTEGGRPTLILEVEHHRRPSPGTGVSRCSLLPVLGGSP